MLNNVENSKNLLLFFDEILRKTESVTLDWVTLFPYLQRKFTGIHWRHSKAGHMVQIKTPNLGGINNTNEAVLYCKEKGIGAYQGGTCNETDRSAQACMHCAMATQPVQILAKPGMGVDECYIDELYLSLLLIKSINAFTFPKYAEGL